MSVASKVLPVSSAWQESELFSTNLFIPVCVAREELAYRHKQGTPVHRHHHGGCIEVLMKLQPVAVFKYWTHCLMSMLCLHVVKLDRVISMQTAKALVR